MDGYGGYKKHEKMPGKRPMVEVGRPVDPNKKPMKAPGSVEVGRPMDPNKKPMKTMRPADKDKMAAALSGYMNGIAKKPGKAPQIGISKPPTSGDAQMGMNRLRDAKNLAAMMKRQRMG